MPTCPQRAGERAITLPQFEQAGLAVDVMEGYCDPPSGSENRWNVERLILLAIERGEDLLIVEDDIDLADDFVPALTAARRVSWPVTFWTERLANHPPEYHRAIPRRITPRFVRVRRMDAWYGAQALLLPLAKLHELTLAPGFAMETGVPFDMWLKDLRPVLYHALPNPVEHRCPEPVRDIERRKNRHSLTFQATRDGDWSNAWPSSTTRYSAT